MQLCLVLKEHVTSKPFRMKIKPKAHVKSEPKSRDRYNGKSGQKKVGGNYYHSFLQLIL
jgi:hypothetical protein